MIENSRILSTRVSLPALNLSTAHLWQNRRQVGVGGDTRREGGIIQITRTLNLTLILILAVYYFTLVVETDTYEVKYM